MLRRISPLDLEHIEGAAFLLKDVFLLGAALSSAGEALRAWALQRDPEAPRALWRTQGT